MPNLPAKLSDDQLKAQVTEFVADLSARTGVKINPEEVWQDLRKRMAPAKRGHRLPDDYIPSALNRQKLIMEFPFVTREEWANQHRMFMDYWVAVPDPRGRKLDWDATWRNWMRKEFSSPHHRRRAQNVASTVDQKIMDMQGMKE